MEWCLPTILRRGVGSATVSVSPLGVWYSKLRLPLYADVHIPMTHRNDAGLASGH